MAGAWLRREGALPPAEQELVATIAEAMMSASLASYCESMRAGGLTVTAAEDIAARVAPDGGVLRPVRRESFVEISAAIYGVSHAAVRAGVSINAESLRHRGHGSRIVRSHEGNGLSR